jgi:glycosyltransferase involved in cell wall biosynthesis
VDARFTPANAEGAGPLRARLGLTGRYVTAMGGAPRRGLEIAVAAWRRLRTAGNPTALVVVGSEQPCLGPGVVYAGAVDDRDWAALLAGADAFCYPTRYEGFGFPALESIASGTPVVCAPVGSLPEVLGDAAEWCEAPTVEAVAAGLHRLLDDPEHAAEVRRRGMARTAAHPSWEDTANLMLSAYRAAAKR